MGVEGISPTVAGPERAVDALSPTASKQERTFFWLGLTCAAALHAVLIFGVASSLPRRMGEQDGALDGITVDLVDEASVFSKTTVPVRAEAARPQPEQVAKPDSPTADTEKPSPRSHDEQKALARSIEKDVQGLLSVPDASEKKSESEATKKSQPKARPSLDLTARLPTPDIPFSAGGAFCVGGSPAGCDALRRK